MSEQTLERITNVRGAFDKRNPDPKKNYGIHSMELHFILKGPKGAVQFLVYTGMHLPHVEAELWGKRGEWNPFHPMGADIGYHSPHPVYEGQTAVHSDCQYTGGECYYDGTSLGADEFMPEFLAGGDSAVWAMLERRYHETFEAKERP